MQKAGGEGARGIQAVFGFKTVKRGQGNAVSAVEMAECLKEVGLQLMVGVRALWLGLCSGVVVAPVDGRL